MRPRITRGTARRPHVHGRRRHRRLPARHLQGRLPRPRRDGAAADVAVRAAAAGRRHHPADRDRAGLPHALGVPARVERLEPQDHAAEHVRRHVHRLADGGVAVGGAHPPRHRADRRAVRAAALDRQALRTLDAEAQRRDRHYLRRDRRRHHHARQRRRPGVADSSAAAEAREAALHRHGEHPVRGEQRRQSPGLPHARLSHARQPAGRTDARADRDRWRTSPASGWCGGSRPRCSFASPMC